MFLVTKIEPLDKREFIIHHPDKTFDLRAKNTEERDDWIKQLRIVVEHLKEHEKEVERPRLGTTGHKFDKFDAATREKVLAENESIISAIYLRPYQWF